MTLPPTGGFIIVEPHADDAFLSCGGLIEKRTRRGDFVTIVTIFSGTRSRGKDAAAYAQAVGAQWVGLGFEEMGNARINGAADFSLTPEVTEWMRASITVIPLGIGGHPEHLRTIAEFEKYPSIKALQYLDQPYASKLKNQDDLAQTIQGRKVFSIFKPGARKWRHIPLFKDQSKFFFHNNAESLAKTFELIVY